MADSFLSERDEALYSAYKRAEGGTQEEKLKNALGAQQPRFWVSSQTIYRIILNFEKGSKIRGVRCAARGNLAQDVIETYKRLRKRKELKYASIMTMADYVSMQPTKGFYISYKGALRRLAAIIKKKKRQRLCSISKHFLRH